MQNERHLKLKRFCQTSQVFGHLLYIDLEISIIFWGSIYFTAQFYSFQKIFSFLLKAAPHFEA